MSRKEPINMKRVVEMGTRAAGIYGKGVFLHDVSISDWTGWTEFAKKRHEDESRQNDDDFNFLVKDVQWVFRSDKDMVKFCEFLIVDGPSVTNMRSVLAKLNETLNKIGGQQ